MFSELVTYYVFNRCCTFIFAVLHLLAPGGTTQAIPSGMSAWRVSAWDRGSWLSRLQTSRLVVMSHRLELMFDRSTDCCWFTGLTGLRTGMRSSAVIRKGGSEWLSWQRAGLITQKFRPAIPERPLPLPTDFGLYLRPGHDEIMLGLGYDHTGSFSSPPHYSFCSSSARSCSPPPPSSSSVMRNWNRFKNVYPL